MSIKENFSSKDLIFLHGYLSCKESFAYQYDFFERDFNVYKFDFTGFGDNKDMLKPYSLDDYVDELLEFIDKNRLNKPNVVAHSFGGRVAIKTAVEHKDLLGKLVLTGSAGLKPKLTIKKLIKRTAFNLLKPFVKKENLSVFYSKDYRQLSPIMQKSFKLIVNEHLDGLACQIQNQTLIINGVLDKETPPYMARRLKKLINNSKLEFIDGAGHFCFIDKPHKFNTEVREFLLS